MNKIKRVVFLGSKDIGLKCLKILNENQAIYSYKLVGVLTNSRGEDIKNYAIKNNLNLIYSLEDYLTIADIDITISIQYHEILKKIHIEKAKELIINLHMAPLPEYRGCNQFSLAIIDNKKIFGTTIHKLEEGIDSGDILFESRFDIPKSCWVNELYKLTFDKSIELFEQSLERIICLNIEPIKQSDYEKVRGCSLHFRNEINNLKEIDLSWDKEKIERYIRGTYMPKFEPPYFKVDEEKIYLQRGLND